MKKNEITFDEAWAFLYELWVLGFLNISKIADHIGIVRTTFSGALNGSVDKSTGKPVVIAEKHYPKIIKFVEAIQLDAWRKNGSKFEFKNNDT